MIFFLILITCLLDIVLITRGKILSWSVVWVKRWIVWLCPYTTGWRKALWMFFFLPQEHTRTRTKCTTGHKSSYKMLLTFPHHPNFGLVWWLSRKTGSNSELELQLELFFKHCSFTLQLANIMDIPLYNHLFQNCRRTT